MSGYLYVLGKIQKQQYPLRMTAKMKKDVMRFEQLREQFNFLRENGIETPAQMEQLQASLGDKLHALTKQRTILNIQKKKQKKLFSQQGRKVLMNWKKCKYLSRSGLTGAAFSVSQL